MSRINTNVQSMIAQRVLGQNGVQLGRSLERLSTGLRVNRGKDDPAGLIASENLRSELKSLNAAIGNSERADQVVNIAEGGLQEVSTLLTELQGLVTASASDAGLSASEKAANQLQIDSILQTVDRIASATSFQGSKLLNGNFDYKVSGVDAGVTDYRINGAKFTGDSLNVDVLVTQSAQQAGLYLSMGGSSIDLAAASSTFTIEVSGGLGTRELTFTSGTSMTSIVAAINSFKSVTGVEATAVASSTTNGIKLSSTKYGSSEFVTVKVTDDGGISTTNLGLYNLQAGDFDNINTTRVSDFASASNGVTDDGQDVGATINGITATASGRDIKISSDTLDVSMTLATSDAQSLGTVGTHALTITGGGADFQLGGQVDLGGKVSIGIGDITSRKLGSFAEGYLSTLASGRDNNVVDGDLSQAQKVVNAAIEQVSSLRGRLGAFQKNTIGATIRSLGVSVENTSAAESAIRDADFAAETAGLTRAQILVAASTNVLSLANSSPQSALQLLG
ncbi:MAG: flagellin [Phycisphaerales bacterium]